MAILNRKITAFTNLIANLPFTATGLTADELQEYWDSSPEELRVKLNGLIDDLLALTGSTEIGSQSIIGVAGNTVYAQLVSLKAIIDASAMGQIPDGSLTNTKLGADIKIGSLASLTTSDKTALVNAINELVSGKMAKSLLTAQGDIIYASAANTPTVLPKGTAGQILQMNSGATAPEWGDANTVVKIAETTLGVDGSITFSSIPQTYKALKVVWKIRGTAASYSGDVFLRFNGDTGTNYEHLFQYLLATNSYSQKGADSPGNYARIGYTPGASSPANYFGVGELLIPNYADSRFKNGLFSFGCKTGSAPADYIGSGYAWWNSTAAINSITLFCVTGSFLTGSNVILYGIK